jgi:hypothetical protein
LCKVKEAGDVHPSAWLATGKPFEYSGASHIKFNPEDLRPFLDPLNDSNVPSFNGKAILGIRHVPRLANLLEEDNILLENTYGRRSIMTIIRRQELQNIHAIGSCWYPIHAEFKVTCMCQTTSSHLKVCTDDAGNTTVSTTDKDGNTTTTTTTTDEDGNTTITTTTTDKDGNILTTETTTIDKDGNTTTA